jgi:elongation factor G
MKEYPTDKIRNVALVSHSSAGKTMLAESLLHFTGMTTRLGKIEDGTTASDHDEEEIRRGISLYTTVLPIEHMDCKINLFDTPGYNDFIGEMISALRVSDAALVLVDAVSGREVGTEIAWRYCNSFKLPRILVINKMNRDNANFLKALDSIREMSDTRLIPIQLPMGEKADFKGVIDLLGMVAYTGNGKSGSEIPAEFKAAAEKAHMELVEAAAEGEDALLEKYLESSSLTNEEIIRGLRNVVMRGDYVPVVAATGTAEIGMGPLLDAIINIFPSPIQAPAATAEGKAGVEEMTTSDSGPLAAYIWKTTADPFVGKQTYFRVYSGMVAADSRVWNQSKGIEERLGTVYIPNGKETIPVKVIHSGDIGMVAKLTETASSNTICDKAHPLTLPVPEYPNALFRVAIMPKTQADSTKISPTLTRLCEEDMTLSWFNESATSQTILQGMGDQHIDVAIRRAETKFQVNLLTKEPKVPYQETITKKSQAMYRHKKQTGGAGQFGEVHLRVEPFSDGEFELKNDIFGGSISSSYIPAIEKGIRNTMKEGILAGYPVHSVRVSVFDGKEHPVDSKPIAFEIAGREAFKLAFMDANPVLEEPIMTVKIIVPENYMGDVLGDLNTRRARVMGMDTEKGNSTISATVPLSEMQRYTTQLRSITGGRGIFSMEFSNYEVVPAHITSELVAHRQKELQDKKED